MIAGLLSKAAWKLAGKAVGGWIMGHAIWFKIIGIAAIVTAAVLYVGSRENAVGKVDTLEQMLATVEEDLEAEKLASARLREQIRRMNAATQDRIERERQRVAAAQRAADQVRAQRDIIAGELNEAHQRFQEAKDHDAELREWAGHPVPAAVWDRLRAATGSPGR